MLNLQKKKLILLNAGQEINSNPMKAIKHTRKYVEYTEEEINIGMQARKSVLILWRQSGMPGHMLNLQKKCTQGVQFSIYVQNA